MLLLCAVGAVLRFYRLGQNSLWIDEVASLRTASEAFWSIPAAAMRHNAFEPPLYFWLLHIVERSFGDGEVSLRFISAMAGALTIPMVWLMMRELSQRRDVATLCAALLALNPLHMWYSQEARPYALLVLFASAGLFALVRARRTGSPWLWGAFAVCSSLAMLTHPVGIVVPMVAWVWVLLGEDRGRAMRPLLVASAAIVVLIAPSYVGLAQSIASATGTGSPERPLTGLELPYTVFTYLGGYSFGPSVREIQDAGWSIAARNHLVTLSLAGVTLALATALAVANRGRAMTWLLVLFALPMLLALLGSAATAKAYNVRYTVVGLIGFAAILGVAIARLRQPLRAAVTAIFCGLFLWSDAQWFFVADYRKDDSRSAIAWLDARLPSGATVAVAPGYATLTLAYYARRSGAHLCLLPVESGSAQAIDPRADALLLTRLHHTPEWQALESEFERRAGSPIEQGTVIGYQLFTRGQSQARRVPTRDSGTC
ncbi:MAG: glycosyltransferase family 39 protein [Gemmatimonadales bacterium]